MLTLEEVRSKYNEKNFEMSWEEFNNKLGSLYQEAHYCVPMNAYGIEISFTLSNSFYDYCQLDLENYSAQWLPSILAQAPNIEMIYEAANIDEEELENIIFGMGVYLDRSDLTEKIERILEYLTDVLDTDYASILDILIETSDVDL